MKMMISINGIPNWKSIRNIDTLNLYAAQREKIIKMYEDEEGVIWAEVKWLIRNQNGVRPNNTMVPRDSLKEKYIRLLIEYYEMKIRFL